MPISHLFVSAVEDGEDETLVRASDWNESHAAPPWVVTLAGGRTTVTPPSGVTEVDVAYRTKIDLTNLAEVHLRTYVVDAASTGTKLLFQTSPDQSAWTTRAEVAVDATGLKIGYLGEVALGEVFCRLATSGGDNSNQLILGAVYLVEGGAASPSAGFAGTEFRAAATASNGTSTSIVVNKPSGTTDDDLLVAFIASDNATISSVPSGWTLAEERSLTSHVDLRVYTKIAASEGSTWTWTASSSVAYCANCLAYTNCPTASVDVTADDTATGQTTIDAPSVTTSVANTLLLVGVGVGGARSTTQGAMTERYDSATATVPALSIYEQYIASSGATGTRTVTLSSSGSSAAITVAVKKS